MSIEFQMACHNEPNIRAAAPASAAAARLISWMLAAPVADAMLTGPAVDVVERAVRVGLLTVVAAEVMAAEVAFQPVGCNELVAFAYSKVLVTVNVE